METRRSRLGAEARYVLRQYEDDELDDTYVLAGLFWDRRLSPVTKASTRLSWYRRKSDGSSSQLDSTNYTDLTLDIGLSRNLTARTEVGAWYRFRDRDSDQGGDDYQENRINIGIRTVWGD